MNMITYIVKAGNNTYRNTVCGKIVNETETQITISNNNEVEIIINKDRIIRNTKW